MQLPLTGSCQCGAVRYEITREPIVTAVCHCLECQTFSASAFSITMLIDADAFKTADGDLESSLRLICEKVHAYGDIST